VDLCYLVRYTELPKLWEIFTLIIACSPLDANGYFTISAAGMIIEDMQIDYANPVTFWSTMSYFLSRKNHVVYVERKREVDRVNLKG